MDRDRSIDIAKGIAILLVIVGHSHCVTGVAHQLIYSFHMPLFFIFAGWFYKERAVKDSFTRDFRRLIVPYLFFEVLCALKFAVTGALQHDWQNATDNFVGMLWATTDRDDTLIWGTMPSAGILWFLPALYWCKNLYNLLAFKCRRWQIVVPLVVILSLSAILLDRYVINIPLGILPGCGAMLFFAIGHLLKECKVNILLGVVGACCWIYGILYSELIMGNSHYGILPVDVSGATFATMLVYWLSQKMDAGLDRVASVLAWCGANSMVIYCMHYVVMIIDLNTRLGVHDWYAWLAVDFSLILPLSYICTRLKATKKLFMIK